MTRARPAIQSREYRRQFLPYGKWICADGSEVLFNRNYGPMHRRRPDGTITSWPPPFWNDDDPKSPTWVHWLRQEWFYDDGVREPEKRKRGIEALAAWGLEPVIPEGQWKTQTH